MNGTIPRVELTHRLRRAVPALAGALALALLIPQATFAVAPDAAGAPDATGSLQGGTPLIAEPGMSMDLMPGGALDGGLLLDRSDNEAVEPIVRPTRVWTTDLYRRPRSTFYRGETIVFWVQLYNPTYTYVRHPLELWADDLIRCIQAPCMGGPQRLFAGTVSVRPGYTNYYLFARAERNDKVGEWNYYATDSQNATFIATPFYLR
jgi:hypothetical protein